MVELFNKNYARIVIKRSFSPVSIKKRVPAHPAKPEEESKIRTT
jgi:hypothetical protein